MSDFSILVTPNSNSPVPNPPQTTGDFEGYADGVVNGHGTGTATPTPAHAAVFGAQISIVGWGNGSFYIVLYGTHPQNYFTSVALGAPANLSFLSASATGFSNSAIASYTYWSWTDSHEFSYTGDTLGVTFSGIAPPVPTPAGNGDIMDPRAWETVSTGKLPPSEYDGFPGGFV